MGYWFLCATPAESCFNIAVFKSSSNKSGWGVKPAFRIDLHKKDADILKRIQAYFSVAESKIGNISFNNNKVSYVVSSLKELTSIVDQFDNYPLLTAKRNDYRI